MGDSKVRLKALGSLRLLTAVVGVLAIVAVLRLPYGYYRLLRFAVFAAAVALAIKGPRKHLVPVVLMGLLFNPFVPVHLTRALWEGLDAGAGVYLLWLAARV